MRDNICIDDRNTAKHLDVDLIGDSSSTHKTKAVKAWLAKHPRFQLLFIPTASSWLNLVERFFPEITRKRIRRGVFTSVAELEAAIEDYLDTHTLDPKPFVDQDRRCHPRQDRPRQSRP